MLLRCPLQNGRGEVVPDRRFNTASMMKSYGVELSAAEQIDWDADDPNELQLRMGGLQVGRLPSAPAASHCLEPGTGLSALPTGIAWVPPLPLPRCPPA